MANPKNPNNPDSYLLRRQLTIKTDERLKAKQHFIVRVEKVMAMRDNRLVEHKPGYGKKYYQFYEIFNKYTDFCKYYILKPATGCYHEIIEEHQRQKPYFDVDITFDKVAKVRGIPTENNLPEEYKEQWLNYEAENTINVLLDCIDIEMKDKNIPYHRDNNTLVFNSHGKGKRSFHVVIDKLIFKNGIQNKCFCYSVIAKMGNLVEYIDQGAYKRIQSLRIYDSTKPGETRYKKLDEKHTTYKLPLDNISDQERTYRILKASLITHYGGEEYGVSKIIEYVYPVETKEFDKVLLSDDDMDNMINLFYKTKLSEHFKVADTYDDSGYIKLFRLSSCFCPICKRDHDHENASLFKRNYDFVFYCYRPNDNEHKTISLKRLLE